MKHTALCLAITTLILSPFAMAGSSIHSEDSIAELKAQMAQLSKRLDSMDTYSATLGKSKKKLAWAEKIKITGDMRYRYEQIDDQAKTDVAGKDDRNRSRIRARFGITAQISDDVTAGIALATGTAGGDPVSSNETLGGANADKGIALDQGYIAWKFYDNMTLTAGKTKVPYFKPGKSGLIFDGDLRPEGAHLKYDNKTLFATVGYNFMNSDDGSSGNNDIIETYGAQAGYRGALSKSTKFTVGLGYYNLPLQGSAFQVGDNTKGFGNTEDGVSNTYLYDYEISQVFAEVKTEIAGVKTTFYGDYVNNDDAKEDTGYVFGVKAGSVKNKGDFAAGYAYQDLEADAVMGGHTDSDFGGGGSDTKGSKISAALGLSKNTQLAITYFDTEYGGANGTTNYDYDRIQVDLKTKF